jgi:hypothetical protein
MSWRRGVGRMSFFNANFGLLPGSRPPLSRTERTKAWSLHGRVLVAFRPHARKAGNPQRLIACVDSRLFQAPRSFQRLLTQVQGPRRADETSGCRCSNSTQGVCFCATTANETGHKRQSSARAAQLIMPQPACPIPLGPRGRCDARCTQPCLLSAAATWFHLRDLQAPSLLVLIGHCPRADSLERDWAAPFRVHLLSESQSHGQ